LWYESRAMTREIVDIWRERIRRELQAAAFRRDAIVAAALRDVLHAIDNTGAPDKPVSVAEPVFGQSAEVPRRSVSEAELKAVIACQAEEREAAASQYRDLGRPEEAARLEAEAALVRRLMSELEGSQR